MAPIVGPNHPSYPHGRLKPIKAFSANLADRYADVFSCLRVTEAAFAIEEPGGPCEFLRISRVRACTHGRILIGGTDRDQKGPRS